MATKPILTQPIIGADEDIWGNKLNTNLENQDIFNEEIVIELDDLAEDIGDVSTLDTTNKEVIGAINELHGEINIIDNKIKNIEFDTIGDIKIADWISIGDIVETNGYTSIGDGGGDKYRIVAAGTGVDDGGSYHDLTGISGQAELIINDIVKPRVFGAIGNGTTDDTLKIINAIKYADIIDAKVVGENLTYLVTGTNAVTLTKSLKLEDFNFVTGTDYTDQFGLDITGDVGIDIKNIEIYGERDTRTEKENWTVTGSFGGVDSISPLSKSFLSNTQYVTKNINMNNIRFREYHAPFAFQFFSYAMVNINDTSFEHCSNKTFHIWHGVDPTPQPENGVTNVTNYASKDCGIMPADFLVDAVLKTRGDNYSPQGSFGAIVSYGRYNIENVYVKNYCSTGVTADRNLGFTGNNIQIYHNDANAFSNNPSGALWLEACNKSSISNIDLFVGDRDSREDITDSSVLQVYLTDGQIAECTNVILETTSNSNIEKVIRGSMTDGSNLSIDNFSIEGTGSDSAIQLLGLAGEIPAKLNISNGRIRTAGLIKLSDSTSIYANNIDSDSAWEINDSNGLVIGEVNIEGCYGTSLDIAGANENILISGGVFDALNITVASGSLFKKCILGGGLIIKGLTYIDGGISLIASGIETDRRFEIINVERANLTGNIFKTNESESIIWFNGVTQNAIVQANSIWIKTGTSGAGYTTFGGSVVRSVDLYNDKYTFDYTL